MASGTQQHQQQPPHQQQQQQQQRGLQQQQSHDQLMRQDQQPQMQFASNQLATGLGQQTYDHQQQPQHRQSQQQQQHQLHQHNTMSPIQATTPIPLDTNQGHIVSLNPHQHQSQQLMDSDVSSAVINQGPCNQPASHVQIHQQQQHQQQQQQQKSQILPLLLSPRPPNLKSSPGDQSEQSENDHDQIIDQVISLENDFNDSSNMLASADGGLSIMVDHQQPQQQLQQQQQQQQIQLMGDMNLTSNACFNDSNQLSSSSEDLLNLLLELDREPSNLIGMGPGQQLDQDEKIGIENIRKQLMSCEVQSDQVQHHQHNTECMSPILNQMTYQPQQSRTPLQQQQLRPMNQQHHNSPHQQQVISQTSPVIPQHQQQQQQQQPHHMSSPSQQSLQNEQTLSTGSYSSLNSSSVPVSSSAQSYAPQQHHSVSRVSQTNPLNIVGSSPSPSWQPPLSPYSPQNHQSNSRVTSQHHGMHHHHQQQQQQQHTTSSQLQQMHHPLQHRSPSHSVSPPATTEPSPVVKKNPLLNAQLVNSRAPSITPTRFMNSQTSVLNQNPILNAKLSQGPYCANTGPSGTSPVPNSQNRYIQSTHQSSNFNFDLTQHQQHNAHQHTPPQSGHMTLYRPSDQQQQQLPSAASSQAYRTTPSPAVCSSPITMLSTSPSGGLSQQVKDEIRRKVQQPKQHQPTSLLKQLLSDDNK